MSKRKVRFELALGMTDRGRERMRNHILDILRGKVIEDLTVNKYNIEITFNSPHAGAFDMEPIREDLEAWQNDNVMLTEDEMIRPA